VTASAAPPASPTARASGAAAERRIGRDAAWATDVVSHPGVSRRHAVATFDGSTWSLADVASANGTWVNGVRIGAPVPLRSGDRVRIGAVRLRFDGATLRRDVAPDRPLLAARELTVRADDGRTLLDGVTLDFPRDRFTCVIGPSGCGKSTLLRALAGRRAIAAGRAHFDGEDLATAWDAVRGAIGFVAQRDAFHEELPVQTILDATASLRLPRDSGVPERDAAVRQAMERAGIVHLADRVAAVLSGGQRRRLALAVELVAQPACLFVDEVTSGLDDASDREIMQVLHDLARTGVTIVCVTHSTAHMRATADHVVALAVGGRVAATGTLDNVLAQMGAADVGGLYGVLQQTVRAPRERALAPPTDDAAPAVRAPRAAPRRPLGRQFATVFGRQAALWRAVPTMPALALLQALGLAALLGLAFGRRDATAEWRVALGFFTTVCAFWFGCSNAAKDVVRELPLVEAEHAAGLAPVAYLGAKVCFLLLVGAVQLAVLAAALLLLPTRTLDPMDAIGAAALAIATGTATGMTISVATRTTDQAATVLPLVIIPQLLLSEALVHPLGSVARTIGEAIVSVFWLHRAVQASVGVPDVDGAVAATVVGGHTLVLTLATLALFIWRRRVS
jgi:ABC-type multidrug transport system ATPase subunit